MVSVLVPISYIIFLFGSLAIFSKYYRRKQNAKQVPEPWFPRHKSRDLYISLLSLETPPPRPILVAALLRRAMEDVRLIWSVRDSKQALQTLLQKGQVGDELWERFLQAEKELEAEIVEVVGEANTFQEGYGQQIFAIASEMVSHERWKEIYEKIPEKREAEKKMIAAGSPAASLALSPNTYLTPSSLTLALANPLDVQVTAGTSAIETAATATSATTPAPQTSLVNGQVTNPATASGNSASSSAPPTPAKNGKARAIGDGGGADQEAEKENQGPATAANSSSSSRLDGAAPVASKQVNGVDQTTLAASADDEGTAAMPPPVPSPNQSPSASGTTTPNSGAGPETGVGGSATKKKKPNNKKKKPAVKGGR